MDRNIPKPVDGYDDGAEPLVFYAPKGSYRKYEQKIYSDLASGVTGPAKGFFKVLVSTRANKLTLMAMIFFVAVGVCRWLNLVVILIMCMLLIIGN